MFGEERLRAAAAEALAASGADETEVTLTAEDGALTRFAGNHIHQNVAERGCHLRVRAVLGARVGAATTNDLSAAGVRQAVRRATEIARLLGPQADWPGLPDPEPIPPMPAPDPETASAPPEARAELVRSVCEAGAARGFRASGALSTGLVEVAVANSRGVWAYGAQSRAQWVAVVLSESGAGYSEWTGRRLADAETDRLGEEAIGKAFDSQDPVAVEPGAYPVVLEPYAVSSLVGFLGMLGFSGEAVLDGRSFLADRRGEKVASERVTIVDDVTHPLGLPLTFDFEGVPRQTVGCVVEGVARAAVWDRRTAARAGGDTRSTGHASPAGVGGPLPMHLVMAPGEASTEQMVADIRRGLWVTRFNYVRTVQPKQTVITGLTRDGTFLIENGRRGRPVRNLRFTESILGALGGVRAVGTRQQAVGGWLSPHVVPALYLERFTFTGTTSF